MKMHNGIGYGIFVLHADFDLVTLAYVCAKARANVTAGPMLTKLPTGYGNVM